MSSTERSHRFREKHAATKPATKQSEADAGAQAAEIARLKAENERLRAANVDAGEIAALRRRAADAEAALKAATAEAQARPANASQILVDGFNNLKSENAALKKQLAAARAGLKPGEEKDAAGLARENAALKDAVAKLEAKLAADPGAVGKLEKQLKAWKTRAQNEAAKAHIAWETVRDKNALVMTKADRNAVWKALHPDHELDPARKKIIEKAAQIFGGLRIREHE